MTLSSDNQRKHHRPEHAPTYANGENLTSAVLCSKSDDANQNPDNWNHKRSEHQATIGHWFAVPGSVDLPRGCDRIKGIDLVAFIDRFYLRNVLAAGVDQGRVILAGVLIRAFNLKSSHGSLLGTLAGGFQ